MEIPKEVTDSIHAIASDNTHGAVELTTRAAEVLTLFAQKAAASSTKEFSALLQTVVKSLIEAQPMMVPMVHLGNEVLQAIENISDANEARHNVQAATERFLHRLKDNAEAVARNAAQLIANGNSILTHSSSSTVFHTLELAKREGKQFRVFCTESRPVGEGRDLAQKLAAAGIPTTLLVDSAAHGLMKELQLVLVGGEAVTAQELVNKIGTLGLALAAQRAGVPFYALCDTTKFLPPDYPMPQERERNPIEVSANLPVGISTLNYYFDRTPKELLTGIVTEKEIATGKI